MTTAKPVEFRTAMLAGVLLATILCLLPAPAVARGRSVRVPHATYSLAVHNGVGSFMVRLAHGTPPEPPVVLYETHPANLDCRATYFDYSVTQLTPNRTALGTLQLRLRCNHVPAGARVRLKLRDPIVLRVPIRRSSGRVAFSLDKPPGRVLPLVRLRTNRIGGPCRTRGTRLRIRRLRLDITSGVTCGRPLRRYTAVLSIGGLLRSRSTRGRSSTGRSAATPPARMTAAGDTPITCTGRRTVTVTCRQSLHVRSWRTIFESYTFSGCPVGYHYTKDGWPGFLWSEVPDVGPRSDGSFFGWWTFSNWALLTRTLNLTWFCGLSAPQLVTPPRVNGVAVVGRSLSCTNGTWNGYPNRFDNYAWLRNGDVVSVGQQYTVTSADDGFFLACEVLAHNAVGSTRGTSLATPRVVSGPPQAYLPPTLLKWGEFHYSIPVPGPGSSRVSGEDWLLCKPGAFTVEAHSYTYQWLQYGPGPGVRPGSPIPGETKNQYQVADSQAGSQVLCQVTATNQAGSTTTVSASTGTIQKGGGGIN